MKVSSGDALFVRTGVWARRKAKGPWLRGRREGGRSAGLDPSVIPWLKQRDVAVMGSDHPQYVSPSPLTAAVHDFALVYLGVHLLDNLDLEALADAAAARNRWEFLLTAAPLPIRGGTGSPLNPIATFLMDSPSSMVSAGQDVSLEKASSSGFGFFCVCVRIEHPQYQRNMSGES